MNIVKDSEIRGLYDDPARFIEKHVLPITRTCQQCKATIALDFATDLHPNKYTDNLYWTCMTCKHENLLMTKTIVDSQWVTERSLFGSFTHRMPRPITDDVEKREKLLNTHFDQIVAYYQKPVPKPVVKVETPKKPSMAMNSVALAMGVAVVVLMVLSVMLNDMGLIAVASVLSLIGLVMSSH